MFDKFIAYIHVFMLDSHLHVQHTQTHNIYVYIDNLDIMSNKCCKIELLK